jgi:hypothetical protein
MSGAEPNRPSDDGAGHGESGHAEAGEQQAGAGEAEQGAEGQARRAGDSRTDQDQGMWHVTRSPALFFGAGPSTSKICDLVKNVT